MAAGKVLEKLLFERLCTLAACLFVYVIAKGNSVRGSEHIPRLMKLIVTLYLDQ